MRTIKKIQLSANSHIEVVTYNEETFYFNTVVFFDNGKTSEDGEMFYTERKALNAMKRYCKDANTVF